MSQLDDSATASLARTEQLENEPSRAGADTHFSSLYHELIVIARRALGTRGRTHSLQATALVHEAYLRLRGDGSGASIDRKGFLALTARVMRCVLVDHARRRARLKRGAGARGSALEDGADRAAATGVEPLDLLVLDDALRCLGRADATMERIVELRFFLGLDVLRTAELLGIPKRSVERKWSLARDALQRLLP
jgi:RNA polymerase sigma factor (TIGR02999 family)